MSTIKSVFSLAGRQTQGFIESVFELMQIDLAETSIFRLKCIFGGKLASRQFDNQAVELFLQCSALNRMIQICKPESYVVEL